MTLSLIALACHFAGDFPLQSDRMASEKFDDWRVRLLHCTVYTLCFLPFVYAAGFEGQQSGVFFMLLFTSHGIIDTRRWAENYEGFPTRALWFDQAYHIIVLAASVAVAQAIPSTPVLPGQSYLIIAVGVVAGLVQGWLA